MALEQPRITWTEGTTFAERLCLGAVEKQAVGKHVIEAHFEPEEEIFLSDGSSTYHLALRLMQKPLTASILTTNIAIAFERALRKDTVGGLHVELAGGNIDSELLMVSGPTTERTLREWASRATVLVVSMRTYDANCGPTERHPPSHRQISLLCTEGLKAKAKIIFVCDHAKLSRPVEKQKDRPVFASGQAWTEAALSGNVWLVTNRPAAPEVANAPSWLCAAASEVQTRQFIANGGKLHGLLGDHYVELPYADVDALAND